MEVGVGGGHGSGVGLDAMRRLKREARTTDVEGGEERHVRDEGMDAGLCIYVCVHIDVGKTNLNKSTST